MSFIEIIIVILIAIVLHEFGHVLGALIAGIKISEISLGFGPPIVQVSIKNITFKLSLILFGGYVKPEKDGYDYFGYLKTQRFIFVISGLIMSIFILPILCLLLLAIFEGGTFSLFSQYTDMFKYIYTHLIHYFTNKALIFPSFAYANYFLNYISCLCEISLLLGLTNAVPIPGTDGGQIAMMLFETKFPILRTSSLKFRELGYLIILLILTLPIFVVFIKSIQTTWPIFILIGFIIYRFIKVK